jgi:hypothetical protein
VSPKKAKREVTTKIKGKNEGQILDPGDLAKDLLVGLIGILLSPFPKSALGAAISAHKIKVTKPNSRQ